MENERESQAHSIQSNTVRLAQEPLLLASSSQRRVEILRSVGWAFKTLPVDINESPAAMEAPSDYVERLAREKAEAASARTSKGDLVLGADTTVVVDELMLGKPRDERDARRMLQLLSGRWHEVLTGVAVMRTGSDMPPVVAHEITRVRFAAMTDNEINWYVATGEPMDKAGAYAVQGRAALFIEEIRGDYWNVVGLPVQLLYKLVQKL